MPGRALQLARASASGDGGGFGVGLAMQNTLDSSQSNVLSNLIGDRRSVDMNFDVDLWKNVSFESRVDERTLYAFAANIFVNDSIGTVFVEVTEFGPPTVSHGCSNGIECDESGRYIYARSFSSASDKCASTARCVGVVESSYNGMYDICLALSPSSSAIENTTEHEGCVFLKMPGGAPRLSYRTA